MIPLGSELEAELAKLAPVSTRRPRRDLVKVASLSLAYAAVLVALLSVRRDLHGLPVWWLITYGAAWIAGFVGLAYLAIVPARGTVMPRWRLVAIGAVLISLGFVGTGLVMHPSGPDSRQLTLDTIHHGHACLELGLATALIPAILGALVLRGAVPVASRWIAAGLGAAGGSLGGLVLHLHCPITDRWHVGLVHGGVVGIAALLAAALVPNITRRSR